MLRRILKITGIAILILVLLLLIAPFLFKGSIEKVLQNSINKNLNATVAWQAVDVSFFRNFPQATVSIDDFTVINKAPFAGDTLARGKNLNLKMGVTQLFKGKHETIAVDALTFEETAVYIKIDSSGAANYDIAIKKDVDAFAKAQPEQPTSGFTFDLKEYRFLNSTFTYDDRKSNTYFKLEDLNHSGSGDFSASESTLETSSSGAISMRLQDITYFTGQRIDLDAQILMDLDAQKYTFKENVGHINDLPLTFDGYIQNLSDAVFTDLTFSTPESDFKNFFALIPEVYRKNLKDIETTGNFTVSGFVKGISNDARIPAFDIKIQSSDASFHYDGLPKTMRNIFIDAAVVNTSGIVEDTKIRLNNIAFKVDDNAMQASGVIAQLTTNMLVNLAAKGTLNLAHIEQLYPLETKDPLSGILKVDLTTDFSMDSVTAKDYAAIKGNGTAQLSAFTYSSPEFPKPIAIEKASIQLSPGKIALESFQSTIGSSDLNATGTIENLIPFILSKEDLKGRFKVNSTNFDLSDFATTTAGSSGSKQNESETKVATENTSIKIPDFLDAALQFQADRVVYDNVILTNVSGTTTVKDEIATLENVSSDAFDGRITLAGKVSTVGATPTFDMALNLSDVALGKASKQLDLLSSLAPIAQAIQGAVNTTIKLQGNLDSTLSPKLETVAGNAFAQLVSGAQFQNGASTLLMKLDDALNFIDLNSIDLNAIKANLTFSDGQVAVKPFDFDVKGIQATVSGGHSFTNEMNYMLSLKVPAARLGDEATRLLSKLSAKEKEDIQVTIPVGISGNFKSPKINLDTKAAINDLTQKIIQVQKDRVTNKVESKLDDLLGGILGSGNTTKPRDTTATNSGATKDSVVQPDGNQVIKDAAKDILGGLFKKKKKAPARQKDSIPN